MAVSNAEYLGPTPMVDYEHPAIQAIIDARGWRTLNAFRRIGAAYDFVRNEIEFGYNADDRLPASRVLKDGYGQCNTKSTLLMAFLRALVIPARFHGFTIYNALQRGAIPVTLFPLAPAKILHSWVEVWYEGRWVNLEGFILDQPYLSELQKRFASSCENFAGYGAATPCLSKPGVEWRGEDTYIQKEGIADDLGVYANPDDFYRENGSNLKGVKKVLFMVLLRHLMNWNLSRIRRRGV